MKKRVEMPTPIDQRGNNPYPTDKELAVIRKWDIIRYTIPDLVEYVRCLWNYADIDFFNLHTGREHLFRKACMKLELHTGGWSGNEDIIGALQQNFLFWSMFWRKHTAGGHYWFEIRITEWNRNLTQKEYDDLTARVNTTLNK